MLNAEVLLLKKHLLLDLNRFPSQSWNCAKLKKLFFSLLLPVPVSLKHYISLSEFLRVDRISWKQTCLWPAREFLLLKYFVPVLFLRKPVAANTLLSTLLGHEVNEQLFHVCFYYGKCKIWIPVTFCEQWKHIHCLWRLRSQMRFAKPPKLTV